MIILLLAGAVVVTASVPQASVPPAAPIAEAADSAAAFAAARLQGSQVAVANLTTESKKVFAQPDGTSIAELAASPIRVKKGETWFPVDASLVPGADGRLRPKATSTDIILSGGGKDAPLVEFVREGKKLVLTWPTALPKPELDGSKATYHDVLPGVDLLMQAEAEGYNQRLLVKDVNAARNPALATLRLGLSADGVRFSTTPTGRIEGTDTSGETVFVAPAATMWDARGPEVATAKVGTTLEDGALILTPSQAMLRDPATQYPVVVDPDMRPFGQIMWAKVFSGYPEQSYVNGTNDGDAWAKSGLCRGWPNCNNVQVARTYFQYDTSFLAGRRIMHASFDTTVVHGPDCKSPIQAHDLYYADWGISWDTKWNNKPNGHYVDTIDVGSACNGYETATWGLDESQMNLDGVSTYFVQAHVESDPRAWRRFDVPSTVLRVRYNTRPNPPYEMKTDPPLPAPCRWCDGTPYLGDNFIRLQSRLSDPDGNDQVHAVWDIYGGPTVEERSDTPKQASGAYHSTDVDLRNRNGQRVGWTVWASDDVDGGDWKTGPGPFVVDQVGIDKPPTVSAPLYKEDNLWHGGVGVPDLFTFDANGVADVDHYLYGWNDPPSTWVDATALGGKAYVNLSPPGDGPRDLYVQSVDRAGHRSPTKVYHFYVRAGNGPLAQWSFEGNTKDTASLGFRDAALHGGTTYSAGTTGSGIRLDGVDDYVSAPVSASTVPSFTVAGWVNLAEKKPGWSTLLSQNASTTAMVKLGYAGTGTDRWAVELRPADSPSSTPTTVVSLDKAQTGTWTHLAAVYDSSTQKVRLYVNGDLNATATWVSPWPAVNEFSIGRATVSSVGSDYLSGAIDEVRTYDRPVSDAEIKSIVTRDNVAAGYWSFDETDGTTARNAAAGGEMAVLQPGAGFTAQGAVNGAATFDGTAGFAATTGPAVRTDQSFAVAAWVKPDKFADVTAVSQDGTAASGFYLKQINGSWAFGMHPADAASGATAAEARTGANTVQLNVWTHLTGVYNSAAKSLTLYVNGKQAGTTAAPATPWNATGSFVLGRAKYGSNVGFWSGGIDEVRAYSRVLAASEIQGIVAQNHVTAATWKLDGNAQDSSGRGLHGTVAGGAQWGAGQTSYPDPKDLAVNLDGGDDYVSAAPAVDTSKSFSFTAWAKLTAKSPGWGAVVSQSGQHVSAFSLGYTGSSDDHWAFAMHGSDADAPSTVVRARSAQTAQVGVWTHLAVAYDATTGEMQLYVNGVLSGTATMSTPWNASTEFDIGRGKWASTWLDALSGSVDDVTAYSRTLFADEIRTLSGQDLTLVHKWELDESSGTNVADSTGSRTATLSAGAEFAPGRVGNAVKFDGAHGAISTPAVDLRTDDSFTVAAWAYLGTKGGQVTAVSIDGAHASKFRLGHVLDNQNRLGSWIFDMPEADSDTASVTKAAVSTSESDVDKWVHLVGVYDKQTKKTWLYVDGNRVGDGTINTPWPATGGVEIGRGKDKTVAAQYWPGSVDDVRLYTGALDKERIFSLYNSYPAADGGPATLPTADAAYWRFDEKTGTAAQDLSGRGKTAALKGGAAWTDGKIGPAAWLDGTSGYAETSGPVLNTTQSFSAAAWVHLTKNDNGYYTVFGQDGTRVSAFLVQYDGGTKKWRAVVPSADKDDPPAVSLSANQPAVINDWTHLAIVYDAQLHQLRLYIGGEQAAVQVGVTTIASSGLFSIGRSRWNGVNTNFFPRGIDDVRVFSKALSDGEVRKVHDELPRGDGGAWRFDNSTGQDYSWRDNVATPTGGATFGPGISGTALQLDGVSGQATAPERGLAMSDSFTVSAWAKLARTDQASTVLGQDGNRMSGFSLQYRPEVNRWTFGSTTLDTDSSPRVYASSFAAPVVNRWTHLAGIYDQAARQLRLYVDGQFAGKQDNVVLWQANGAFSIGRSKYNGQAAEFFPGMIDEVYANYGMTSETALKTYGTFPAADAGQLARYADGAGRTYTASTSSPPPAGYHLQTSLGMLITGSQPNTRTLYACQTGADQFTSTRADCEGATSLGQLGQVYNQQPTNIPTVAVYRCRTSNGHLDSRQADCEGATQESLLGYTLAYAPLVRYYNNAAYDHLTTTQVTRPGYYAEFRHGYIPLTPQPGTQSLMSCTNDADQFISLDAACEGKTSAGQIGQLWTQQPEGGTSKAIYRCGSATVESMTNDSDNCGQMPMDRFLGYVITTLPTTAPVFATPAAKQSDRIAGQAPAPLPSSTPPSSPTASPSTP